MMYTIEELMSDDADTRLVLWWDLECSLYGKKELRLIPDRTGTGSGIGIIGIGIGI